MHRSRTVRPPAPLVSAALKALNEKGPHRVKPFSSWIKRINQAVLAPFVSERELVLPVLLLVFE
jgi:hypothetical protein